MANNPHSNNSHPPGSSYGHGTHAPTIPSNLRTSEVPPQTPGAESVESPNADPRDHYFDEIHAPHHSQRPQTTGMGPSHHSHSQDPDAHSRLLSNWDNENECGKDDCPHGSFSPHATVPKDYGSFMEPTSPTVARHRHGVGSVSSINRHETYPVSDNRSSRRSSFAQLNRWQTTKQLAREHGLRHMSLMYLDYYIPFLKWIRQYTWGFFAGDLIAALTMASFYIPMSLSYASNLAHIPAINGLYAFAINPIIYAMLGSCPQLVVGPEAAGSLLVGNIVRDSIAKGHAEEVDKMILARVAGVSTTIAGLFLLVAGFARLGFLDNVLSRPFLRGFISSIGFVILVDQLLPELGLEKLADETGGVHSGSTVDKIVFLARNIQKSHPLTCAVSFTSFAIIMVCRSVSPVQSTPLVVSSAYNEDSEIKKRLQPRYGGVAYIPDRFIVVVLATVFCWRFQWYKDGLDILGPVRTRSSHAFPVHNPFDFSHMKHIRTALGTSFIIALLGFFETSVAAKSLGSGPSDGIRNMQLSPNRELVALGVANSIGGIFMALPAFGGYGRSKVNASTGGRTPMSNVFLAIIAILCVLFLVPAFYYIPKGVLSAMISVVSCSLIEEAPHDLRFFWSVGGWSELFLIFLVILATIFYSLPLGIACGIAFSLLMVIKHSTRPRIQILGRVHGTDDVFENAEADPERMEFIEGCLIVKIPEPLTFANTGDLKNRLRRLEEYGTEMAHPALPRVTRDDNSKNLIFDVHGVTSLDAAGAQILFEIVQSYRAKGVRIFFCRIPSARSKTWRLMVSSGIVDTCGGPRHFVSSVSEALRMSELESYTEQFGDIPQQGNQYDVE